MSDWNKVYAEKKIEQVTPATVLIEDSHLLTAKGKALDYACGLAGNAFYLAENGYEVEAWDLSSIAVDKINQQAVKHALNLRAEKYDLEAERPAMAGQFDVVVVSYFLHRESLRYLYDILNVGGLLFYQTFSGEKHRGKGPSSSNFRLNKNELLNVFYDMQLLFYREDDMSVENGNARQGQTFFVAKK